MKISVWDTYVKRENGIIMHFDILVPSDVIDEQTIFNFEMEYLESKPFMTDKLTNNECRFCHIEEATDEMIKEIESNGFFIIEMENCN